MPSETNSQDDDISEGCTEDTLIGSRSSSETVSSTISENDLKCCSNWTLIIGLSLVICGISMLIYTPFQFLLDQRIHMTPGLPAFEWWFHPPDEVLLRVYLFNITNSEKFLTGIDSKLKLKEVGPFIYREKLTHSNAVFNENGTLTYTANRSPIFLPELNKIDLNVTLIMPNLGVLLIPVYFFDAPFFTKLGINMMMRSMKSDPFVTTTVQKYLWNETDPMLNFAQKVAPSMVPSKNVGVLARIYANPMDNVTVYIGPKYNHSKFFLIDRYDGSEYLPGFGSKCHLKVMDSTEGLSYPQFLSKNDVLKYWRKTLCKVGDLIYAKEVVMYGVTAFKYDLSVTTYDRTTPTYDDCHRGYPILPNGLSDVSTCNFDTSIAASFPHYLYADEIVKNYVDGLEPDEEKHQSYVITEPITGIPLHGVARSQVNLVMKDMRGYNAKIQRFSNITIPLVWLEYDQVGIPWYIHWLIYITVILVPILQRICTAVFLVIGLGLIYYFLKRARKYKSKLVKNKALQFESEQFLSFKALK